VASHENDQQKDDSYWSNQNRTRCCKNLRLSLNSLMRTGC